MKNQKKISCALAAASCCLSGIAESGAAELGADTDIGNWDINSAVLFYSESDGRVSVVEPVISATKAIDTDESVTLKLVLDSLTGASANGAVPSSSAQTFTRPSGNGSYTVPAGETPLDDTFKDTRVALSGSWEKPLSRLSSVTLDANISNEYDYSALSVSSTFERDFNQRNTTLSAGVSLGQDTIEPVGGIPTAFGHMQPPGALQPRAGGAEDDKTIIDALFGVTQVLDQNSLVVLNYSLGQSDGYLTDPYKLLSVVDPVSGEPVSTVYENRPDSRTKHSIYSQYKRYLDGDVLDTSVRFMTDDWGIDSTTLDVRYRWRVSPTSYFQPHFRYYTQSAADFYQPYLVQGNEPGAGDGQSYATADYRLGELNSTTFGVEYGRDNTDNPWALSLEYYVQSGEEPSDKPGQLAGQTLVPDVKALMLRFNYDF